MLQLNPIYVLFIYAWKYLLRNTLDSSLMILETRCLKTFPFYASLLWIKSSTLICQDFHQIGYLPFRHPCMLSLDLPSMDHPSERSNCWLYLWYISKLFSTNPFWYFLIIWWRLQNVRVLEWSLTFLILIIPT